MNYSCLIQITIHYHGELYEETGMYRGWEEYSQFWSGNFFVSGHFIDEDGPTTLLETWLMKIGVSSRFKDQRFSFCCCCCCHTFRTLTSCGLLLSHASVCRVSPKVFFTHLDGKVERNSRAEYSKKTVIPVSTSSSFVRFNKSRTTRFKITCYGFLRTTSSLSLSPLLCHN